MTLVEGGKSEPPSEDCTSGSRFDDPSGFAPLDGIRNVLIFYAFVIGAMAYLAWGPKWP